MRDDFILQAWDNALWCPVLEARVRAPDAETLRTLLGADAADDPGLERGYELDAATLAAIMAAFGVPFDPEPLAGRDINVGLSREHSIRHAPYLIHTGYELLLMLDGRKTLAKFVGFYPPENFPGEERFDHWVTKGVLHKETVLEPFDQLHMKFLGNRTVYYTRIGEEWRVPAMKLIWSAGAQWNATLERLEGTLFGYTREQNDWWINVGPASGGFGGIPMLYPLTQPGMDWLHAAGFRAVPPPDATTALVYRHRDGEETPAALLAEPGIAGVVVFPVPYRGFKDRLDPAEPGPWRLGRDDISSMNAHLSCSVRIVAQRSDLAGSARPPP